MATVFKTCKVCGKQYEYCHTNRPAGLFRWQDVACSPECGAEYFKRVAIARGEYQEEDDAAEKSAPVSPADTEPVTKKRARQQKKKSEESN